MWSAHTNLIAFIRRIDSDFEVMTIHPDGSGLTQLTHTHGNEAHLAWSPDGEQLLFTSSRMGFKDEAIYTGAPQPYGEIFVMRKDGTTSSNSPITSGKRRPGVAAFPRPCADRRCALTSNEVLYPVLRIMRVERRRVDGSKPSSHCSTSELAIFHLVPLPAQV